VRKGIVLVVAAAALYAGGHKAIPASVTGAVAPVAHGSNEALANSMAVSGYGWTGSETTCLDELWTRESGFSTTATNPTSGAYGIPQSLPADKMATAGADWQTNPVTQVKWGLGYIHDRYGTPCGAWSHETADNWY
jgi:resuscitation-promoting factor RpfB